MSPAPFPVLPPGGLTAAQLQRFVEEASRAYWEGVASNGLDALLDFHLRATCRKQFSVLWDAYNTQDAIPKSEDGGISHTADEPLPWLDFQKFAPSIRIFRDAPITETIDRIKDQAFHATKAHFLWGASRGIVADYRGGKLAGYSLIRSPYPPTDEYTALQSLSAEALEAEYLKNSNTSFVFPFTYKINGEDGKPYTGSASIGVRLELCRDLDKEAYRLRSHVGIEFTPPPPWNIDPLAFWNAAEEAIDGLRPNIFLPDLDWGHYISAAILAEPGEPADPDQLEMPLNVPAASIVNVLDLAVFAFPSDTASRLVTQAWGVQIPKEQKELARLLEIPIANRKPQETQRIEEIKKRIILSQTINHTDEYEKSSVTLETKGRETNSVTTKATITVRPEAPPDGGAVTDLHLDEAVERFLKHFGAMFHGQGLRHWALILKELIQNGWVYEFETSEHIAKMRTLKPGESPSKEERQRAQSIVTYLCDTFLDVQSKKGQKHAARAQRFFYIDARTKDKRRGEVFTIRATPELMTLFRSSAGSALQYVPMLESIVREDHQDHGIAIALYFHLAPLWRMDPIRKMKVRDVFDLIGKDPSPENEHRKRDLKKLEAELDYMVAQAPPYLGSWEASGGDADRPSKCRQADPFDVELTLTAPDWKRERIDRIQANRAAFLPKPAPKAQGMDREALEAIIKASGLPSANKFAEAVGISRGFLSKIRAGAKEITPAIEAKIRARFGATLPA